MTGTIRSVPWLLALATALWFALMARKAGRSWFGWALGGGLFALVTATLTLGLAQAAFIPISTEAYISWRAKSIGAAILLIVCLGWLFTLGLHRQHLVIWRAVKKLLGSFQTEFPARQDTPVKK